MPSRRARSRTCRAKSGRSRALATSDFFESATRARSVPELIAENELRTSTAPRAHAGGGTSRTTVRPLRSWRTCFTPLSLPLWLREEHPIPPNETTLFDLPIELLECEPARFLAPALVRRI